MEQLPSEALKTRVSHLALLHRIFSARIELPQPARMLLRCHAMVKCSSTFFAPKWPLGEEPRA